MKKGQKQTRKKVMPSAKTVNKSGKKQSKKVRKSLPATPARREWNTPVLLLMLCIIAIPVLGPTPQMQGFPWIIRLSFLLPALPLLLLYVAYKQSAITISLQPVMLALWGIVFLAVLSSLWALNVYGAITGSIKWFYVALMSIAVYSIARDADSQHKIMVACALAGGYMAFVGVTQYLFGHEVYITPVGQYPWPSATSGHKNMASQFVIMSLPFALYLSLTAKKPVVYWSVNLLISLMLAYAVYGRARQVLVALIVQILVLLLVACFTRTRRLITPFLLGRDYFISALVSLVILAALVVAPPFDKPFSWDKTPLSEFAGRTEVFAEQDATLEAMSSGRYATWLKTVAMIGQHPAGVGLRNWTEHYPKFNVEAGDFYRTRGNDVWGDAHNDYLQMLAELGLASLLIAGMLILGIWKIYRSIWMGGNESSLRRSLFIGMGLMALFTVMMFSYPLQLTATPVFMGIYLALLAAIASFSLPSRVEKRLVFGPVLLVAFLLLSITGAYFGYREISAWNHGFAAKAIGEKVFQPVDENPFATRRNMLMLAQHADRSMELQPYATELLRDNITNYTNLSLTIDHERLAETYRQKALEAAMRYLSASPNDSLIHMIVATRLQLPPEMAMEHLGKAIALDPANEQLYESLKGIGLPNQYHDQMLTCYEYFIPRFFNQKINQEYAYVGQQAKQEERVINTLGRIDLSRNFTPDSSEYEQAQKDLQQLIQVLEGSM